MKDGMRKEQNKPHHELRQHIGHHMVQRDARRALPQLARNFDELRLAALQHLGTNDARKARPMRHGNADGHAPEALPDCIGDEHQKHDVGNSHHEVNQPADHRIDALPAKRGSTPEHECDNRRDGGRQQAHQHACGQSRKRARKHVATHPVGAEGVGKRGRQILRGEVRGCRLTVKRKPRRHHNGECTGGRDARDERGCPIAARTLHGSM